MIKQKLKKILKNTEIMLLILILIALTLCIRNSEEHYKIQIVINSIMIGYIGWRLIKKEPIKLIQSKLDILVLLLVLSTAIPIITIESGCNLIY